MFVVARFTWRINHPEQLHNRFWPASSASIHTSRTDVKLAPGHKYILTFLARSLLHYLLVFAFILWVLFTLFYYPLLIFYLWYYKILLVSFIFFQFYFYLSCSNLVRVQGTHWTFMIEWRSDIKNSDKFALFRRLKTKEGVSRGLPLVF